MVCALWWLTVADLDSVRSNRQPFQQRTFRLVDHEAERRLVALIENLPVDADPPLEVVIREEKRKRCVKSLVARQEKEVAK